MASRKSDSRQNKIANAIRKSNPPVKLLTSSLVGLPDDELGEAFVFWTMSCCTSSAEDYVDDDHTKIVTNVSHDSASTEDSEVLNTDYRKVSPLFRNIEKENWEGVLMFLNTGKWSNSLLSSSNGHLRSPGPEIQVKTWVTSYDRRGEPEWSQLPIHAAISYLAPFVVIQKLIELYPRGIHCTDNEGMLPVHLAFGFGAPDNVIALLLEPFPASINEKGLGGRYPYECCALGPHKTRGKVFRIVSEQVVARSRRDMEAELREFASQAVKTVGVKGYDLTNKEMTQFVLDLLHDRKELDELKARARAAEAEAVSVRASPSLKNTAPSASPSHKNGFGGGNKAINSPSNRSITPASVPTSQSSPKNTLNAKSTMSPSAASKRSQKVTGSQGKSKMTSKPPSAPRPHARNRNNNNSNSSTAAKQTISTKFSI